MLFTVKELVTWFVVGCAAYFVVSGSVLILDGTWTMGVPPYYLGDFFVAWGDLPLHVVGGLLRSSVKISSAGVGAMWLIGVVAYKWQAWHAMRQQER